MIVQNATYHVNGTYAGLANIATTLNENLFEHYGHDYSADGRQVTFAVVFGVLFSGVTGNLHRQIKFNELSKLINNNNSLNRHHGWSKYVGRIEESGPEHPDGNIVGRRLHIRLLCAAFVFHQRHNVRVLITK